MELSKKQLEQRECLEIYSESRSLCAEWEEKSSEIAIKTVAPVVLWIG